MTTRTQRRVAGRLVPALLLAIGALSGCTTVGDRVAELTTDATGPAGATDPAGPSAQLGSIDSVAAAGRSTTSTVPVTATTPATGASTTTTTVRWRPPRAPATVDGMQSYLRQKLGCDTFVPSSDPESRSFRCWKKDPVALADYNYVYATPWGSDADLAAGKVADGAPQRLDAVWDGLLVAQHIRDEGRMDGGPVSLKKPESGGCWIVVSAGPWTVSYAEYSLRPGGGSAFTDVIDDLDAVVHEDCGMPELGPDTMTLVDQIGGTPTCAPVEVALPTGGPAGDGVVDWADYDVAFTCSNGYSMVRVPPGTVDSFNRWSADQIGCRPYVAVGRWVIHQSATTAMPADYDQSVLIGIGMTYGTYVVNPCSA